MKKNAILVVMVLMCCLVLMSGTSQAVFYGTIYDNETYASQNPDNPGSITPDATFTVDSLNFSALTGPVTYGTFLSTGGNLQWLTGASLATQNMTTSTGVGSMFQFTWTGQVVGNDPVTVTHDDGFALFVGGTTYDFSTPTTPLTNTFNLTNTPGLYQFTLNYGAYNSYPEVLTYSGPAPVPEPSTLLLLGGGLIGLVGLKLRKRA